MELWLRYQKPLAFGCEACLARFTPGRHLELGRAGAPFEPSCKQGLLPIILFVQLSCAKSLQGSMGSTWPFPLGESITKSESRARNAHTCLLPPHGPVQGPETLIGQWVVWHPGIAPEASSLWFLCPVTELQNELYFAVG